jgi:hypothetical protein
MNSSDFTKIDHILSDVVTFVGDENLMLGYSIGFYRARIHDAIRELALDTYYPKFTKDTLDWNKDNNCRFTIPINCFNVREIYLYNKTCSDSKCSSSCNCSKNTAVEVHLKRRFNNTNKVNSSKINSSSQSDPVNRRGFSGGYSSLYYCSIQNGVIMLSDNCENYNTIRLVYNGTSFSGNDDGSIPSMFQQAVTDYAVENSLRAIKNKDKSRRVDWSDAYNILYRGNRRHPGTWKLALRRAKSLSTFEKNSIKAYTSNYEH